MIICLYIDDMLIFGTDLEELEKTKCFLSFKFSIKDMGEANVILGIKIIRHNDALVCLNHIILRKCLGDSITKIAPQWSLLSIQPISCLENVEDLSHNLSMQRS